MSKLIRLPKFDVVIRKGLIINNEVGIPQSPRWVDKEVQRRVVSPLLRYARS